MKFINLTPHNVRYWSSIEGVIDLPSTGLARVSQTPGTLREVGFGVTVASPSNYGKVTGLPDVVEEGTLYIVSMFVAQALRATKDSRVDACVVPGTGPLDECVRLVNGQVSYVTRFVSF